MRYMRISSQQMVRTAQGKWNGVGRIGVGKWGVGVNQMLSPSNGQQCFSNASFWLLYSYRSALNFSGIYVSTMNDKLGNTHTMPPFRCEKQRGAPETV